MTPVFSALQALRTSCTAVIAGAALLLTPAMTKAAFAESDPAKVEAQSRFEEGLALYQQKDFEGARLKFTQAYAVLSSLDILYNLAASEVRSGHALESIVHLRQLLRDPRSTDVDRSKAQKLLNEANALTGHVVVDAPEGAVVTLDSVPSGEAPLREALDVRPGKHLVTARFRDRTRSLEVAVPAGETVTAHFAIEATALPTASAPVPLTAPDAPVAAGSVTPFPPTGTVPPEGADARDTRAPRSLPTARIVVPVALGVVALAAGTAGAVFAVQSQSRRDDVDAYRAGQPRGFCAAPATAACGPYQSLLDDESAAATRSRVFYVTGAVFAVGAIATFALWPHERGTTTARRAWIAPTAGGAQVGGTF